MRVAFRVDADPVVGMGHLMRCIALAAAWERHATPIFVISTPSGAATDVLRRFGYEFLEIPRSPDWQADADATIRIVDNMSVENVVCDHYSLDARWETKVKRYVHEVGVIDDLANRSHAAEWLVDHNFGRCDRDYARWITGTCRFFVGPKYALLQHRFSALRPETLARRKLARRSHLVVALGGGDTTRTTNHVAKCLQSADLGRIERITLIGSVSDALCAGIERNHTKKASPPRLNKIPRTSAMADLLSDADFAIGGGGISNWERCCLGLPSLIVTIAENQRRASLRLADEGYAYACVDAGELTAEVLSDFFNYDSDNYASLSERSATLVDGKGAERVVEALNSSERGGTI